MNKQTTWLSFYSTSFLSHVPRALSTLGTNRKRLHIDQQGHWLDVTAWRGETEAARLGSSPHQRNTLVLVKRSKVIQLPSSNRGRSSRPPAAFTLCSMSFKRKQTTRTSRHKPAEQRIPQQDVTNSFIRLTGRVFFDAGDQFCDANNISILGWRISGKATSTAGRDSTPSQIGHGATFARCSLNSERTMPLDDSDDGNVEEPS